VISQRYSSECKWLDNFWRNFRLIVLNQTFILVVS
jgi:hypothetical protein